ncbi:MAG: type II secretion system F family protein [Ruminococcus albus]|nr:type II secretion system F family protein [Ruminococcus albus]
MGLSIIMLLLLIAVSIVMALCMMKSDNYSDYVDAIDKKQFAGAQYYGIGFAMIDLLKMNFNSDSVHMIKDQACILFGRRYADFYVRVLYAQTYTYVLLLVYSMLFLACVMGGSEGALFVLLAVVSGAAIYKYYLNSFGAKIEKMNETYMRDFPNAVSTIALLVNGGMFLREAWKQVAISSDEPLYVQMRGVVDDMNNGVSEIDALFRFANRCSTKEIRKFSTTITQAIESDGTHLADTLIKQADLLLNEKKQMVLQQGEKASNKLMFPIGLIFIGVLVMIMVPILSNMSM